MRAIGMKQMKLNDTSDMKTRMKTIKRFLYIPDGFCLREIQIKLEDLMVPSQPKISEE